MLFWTWFFNIASGQELTNSAKLPKYRDRQKCVYKEKYSRKQRRQFYPFNVADTIKLVSFRYHNNKYPVSDSIVIYDSLAETKTLNNDDIEKLTDILYNNFYYRKPPCCIGTINQCFYPRNAILFLDKNGKPKEYLLICFSCNRIELSSYKIMLGDDCTQKIDKLLAFFTSSGIQLGTDRNIDIYPGERFSEEVALPI